MSQTTYKFPDVVSTEAITNATDWTNPDEVKTSDDTNATCTSKKSYWLRCLSYLGFAAAIPATARIVGVEVAIEGGLVKIEDSQVYLCYKGKRIGTDRAHNVEWNALESTYVHGGSYDTWGLALTPAGVKDTSFGVHIALKGDGSTMYIDSVSMQITYIDAEDTEVQICNEALGRIGEPVITDLDGTDVRSKICKLFYNSMRNKLLEGHIWHFAVVHAKLEKALTPPLFNWAYAYALPSNFLKMSDIYPAIGRYEIGAGNVVYTNISDGYIEYVADMIDPALFSADFKEALIYKLALAMHPSLVDKTTSYQVLQREAAAVIRQAIHQGTIHQKPSKETFEWTTELRT
jgi:hypothetical protein